MMPKLTEVFVIREDSSDDILGLKKGDPRLQMSSAGDKSFIGFETMRRTEHGPVVVVASRMHWKQVNSPEGTHVLWDQANGKGIVPITKQAKEVAEEFANVLHDALGDVAQVDPSKDLSPDDSQKIFRPKGGAKNPYAWSPASADPLSPIQTYSHDKRYMKNSRSRSGAAMNEVRTVPLDDASDEFDEHVRTAKQKYNIDIKKTKENGVNGWPEFVASGDEKDLRKWLAHEYLRDDYGGEDQMDDMIDNDPSVDDIEDL